MIYLIDFENVHEEGFGALGRLGDRDAVYCFFTRNASKIGMSALANLRSGQLHFIEAESGKQSLDMVLVSYLGYLIGTKPQELYYDIISNDNGFGKVAEFWNKRGNGLRVRVRKTNDLKPKTEAPKQQTGSNSLRQQVQTVQAVQIVPEKPAAEAENMNETPAQPAENASAEQKTDHSRQPVPKQHSGRQRSQRQRSSKQQDQVKSNEKETDEQTEQMEQPGMQEMPIADNTESAAEKRSSKQLDTATRTALEAAGINIDAAEFIQAQAEKFRDDKNKKQLVYRAVVKKYGQKEGTKIYNSSKKFLLK